jgi:myo-inositol-1-phosphate synthase
VEYYREMPIPTTDGARSDARRRSAATTWDHDVEFVAAFDVDASKVGATSSKAVDGGHNNTIKFADVGHLDVTVQRGPTFDGLGKYYREIVEESPPSRSTWPRPARARADVLVSYLPVGSEEAQRYYAQACSTPASPS